MKKIWKHYGKIQQIVPKQMGISLTRMTLQHKAIGPKVNV